MNFIYASEKDKMIIEGEATMIEAFNSAVDQFRKKFYEYGFTIKTDIYWYNYNNSKIYLQRIKFCDGYQCMLNCEILKNGQVVTLSDEEDSQLSVSWGISMIEKKRKRKFLKHQSFLEVVIATDTNEVSADLSEFLSIIKSMSGQEN